ncbi:MAG: tetraacyldisaccharide 4'-kinase, partial [Leeuwenhoekiella sp.]|nr:tetraacyldisaccharide 4'-kinase [Leeuwenhoekiella sp.]
MIQPVVRKYKNYNFEPVKNARKILWPFAVPYDGVTRLRNYLFDQSVFDSYSYDFPVIGIGNLSTGGTGKSPMTEYI